MVIHFSHYLVSEKKRFDCLEVMYPIRDHSYIECNRNMSIIDNSPAFIFYRNAFFGNNQFQYFVEDVKKRKK